MQTRAQRLSEDWLSVWIGLLLFVLSLAVMGGADLLGWVVTTQVWTDASKALGTVSKRYAGLGGVGALIVTYLALLIVLTAGAAALRANVARFAAAFTAVFWIAYLCWIAGSFANFAANTPADMKRFGIGWSLRLTSEGGFIIALLVGLFIGNFMPAFAAWMREAVRPELYVKIAIVLLGGFLGVTAAEKLALATHLMFLGLAAIIVAYLIFWSVVYYVARVWFGFSREWAAPLASGISVCGVSAAIAIGTAATVKVFIDIFIGVWAFVLAYIWTTRIEKRDGDRARLGEVWLRFPKFVIGYVVTFFVILFLAIGATPQLLAKVKAAMGEA